VGTSPGHIHDMTMFCDWEKVWHAKRYVDQEQPQHRIHVSTFHISRTPVTNAQYAAFVQATGCRAPHGIGTPALPHNWDPQTRQPPRDKLDHPVVLVSWDNAHDVCDWTGDWDPRLYTHTGCQPPGTTPVGLYSPAGNSPAAARTWPGMSGSG
jgi:hypothetical protein